VKKIMGALAVILGIFLMIYNYFFKVSNITKSAVMQLEDSDVMYGIGSRLATTNTSLIFTVISLLLIIYGIYIFNKSKNGE